jgi:hypothetical protein
MSTKGATQYSHSRPAVLLSEAITIAGIAMSIVAMASLLTALGHFTRDTKMKNVRTFVVLTTDSSSKSATLRSVIVSKTIINKKARLHSPSLLNVLGSRGLDSNQRPSGYESNILFILTMLAVG